MKNKTKKLDPFISESVAEKLVKKIGKAAWKKFTTNCTTSQKNKLGPFPLILWQKKGFQIAGMTYFGSRSYIIMNTNYLYSIDYQDFINDTILHELAHVIAGTLYKEFGHGPAWKKIAIALGDNGNRCHDLHTPLNRVNCKDYVCPHCNTEFNWNDKQHKKYTNGSYLCTCCKHNLKEVKVKNNDNKTN